MEANWVNTPPEGVCIVCGTSANDSGFVDLVGDTVLFNRDGLDQIGVEARMVICANCIRTSARLVGCATPQEVDDLNKQILEKDEEIERLNGEINGWQNRFLGIVNLSASDFDKLATAFESSADLSASPQPAGPASGPDGTA